MTIFTSKTLRNCIVPLLCGFSWHFQISAVLPLPLIQQLHSFFPDMTSPMPNQVSLLTESFPTNRATKGSLPGMNSHVYLQISLLTKRFAANRATKGFLPRMSCYVSFQRGDGGGSFTAKTARAVSLKVDFQILLGLQMLSTQTAVTRVDFDVAHQRLLVGVRFSTHLTKGRGWNLVW